MNSRINGAQDKKYGCSICFTHFKVDEKVFVCDVPCNKLFHYACLFKSVEDQDLLDINCCYCKRNLITEEKLFDFDKRDPFISTICKMRHIILYREPPSYIPLIIDSVSKSTHIKYPKQSKKTFYHNKKY